MIATPKKEPPVTEDAMAVDNPDAAASAAAADAARMVAVTVIEPAEMVSVISSTLTPATTAKLCL